MDQGTIIIIIQGLIFLVLGRVIYAQEKIMKGYRDYLSIFDIDKIKKLHKWQEQIMVNKARDVVRSEASDLFKKHLDKFQESQRKKLEPMMVELEKIAWNLIASLPKEWRELYIKDHMDVNRDYFLRELPNMEHANPEVFDTTVDQLSQDEGTRQTPGQTADAAGEQ